MDRAPSSTSAVSDRLQRAAEWLNLAAAPAFAIMAAVSIFASGEPSALICSAAPGPSWLAGMTPMYMLMSTIHLGAWLRLITKKWTAAAKHQGEYQPLSG